MGSWCQKEDLRARQACQLREGAEILSKQERSQVIENLISENQLVHVKFLIIFFSITQHFQTVQSIAVADLRALPQEGQPHDVLQGLPPRHVRVSD